MKPRMKLLAAMIFLAACAGDRATKAADDVEALTAAAAAKWKAQREGVVSGRFSVRLYRYMSFAYKQKISAQEFRAIIDGKDANGVEAALGKLQNMRGETSIEGFKPFWGVPIEISCEGIKWRNEWKNSSNSVYVFNGNERLEYRAGIEQATIKPGRTRLAAFSLENICDIPKESIIKEIQACGDKSLKDGKITVNMAKRKIIFDTVTGFINLHAYKGLQNKWTEVRQTSPMQLEGDFVFPQVKIRADYEENYVRSFEVLLLDKAELNGPISPDAFVISVPAKTTIVDTREKMPGGYPNRMIEESVPDMLAFADLGELKRIPELQLPQPSRARWLYALLSLPLLILTVRLLMKRWKTRISNG